MVIFSAKMMVICLIPNNPCFPIKDSIKPTAQEETPIFPWTTEVSIPCISRISPLKQGRSVEEKAPQNSFIVHQASQRTRLLCIRRMELGEIPMSPGVMVVFFLRESFLAPESNSLISTANTTALPQPCIQKSEVKRELNLLQMEKLQLIKMSS